MSDAVNPEALFFVVEDDIGDFAAVDSTVKVNNVVAEMVDIKIVKDIIRLQKIMGDVVNVEGFGVEEFA